MELWDAVVITAGSLIAAIGIAYAVLWWWDHRY